MMKNTVTMARTICCCNPFPIVKNNLFILLCRLFVVVSSNIDVFCNILNMLSLYVYNRMIFFAINHGLLHAKVRTKWDNDK